MHKDPEPEQFLYKSNHYDTYMKKFVGKQPPAVLNKESEVNQVNDFYQTK